MPKQYDRKDVEEILRRALSQESEDAIAHEDLVAAAAEVGVSPDAVEKAAAELRKEKVRNTHRAEIISKARARLRSHALTYAAVNAGLFTLDMIDGPGLWFYFPLIGWGIGLALQAISAFSPNEQRLDRKVNKALRRAEWRKQYERPQRPQPAVDRGQRSRERAAKIQRIVDDGIDLALDQISDQLSRKSKTDVGATKPRVRVDADERLDSELETDPMRRKRR